MQHCRAKRIIKTKYKRTKVDNYRRQNDNLNTLETCTFLDCDQYRMNYDGHIDITRCKRALGIQYKHKSMEDITGFISKPVARPEYGTIYQCKVLLPISSLVVHKYIVQLWGILRECTLGSFRVLRFYQHKYIYN